MKTFGKRPATEELAALEASEPPAEAGAPAPRKRPAPPPKRDRDRSGAGGGSLQLKSLARQDLARRSATMDDLEYALEGLGRRAALPVLQRSAYDLVAVCAPELDGHSSSSGSTSSFLSSCGGVAALARGLRCVPSSDPLVGLCVAALLHALAEGGATDASSSRHVVMGTIHRFQLVTADLAAAQAEEQGAAGVPKTKRAAIRGGGVASPASGGSDSTTGALVPALSLSKVQMLELWAHLERLSPLVAEAGLSEASAEELPTLSEEVVRRICLDILVGRTRRSTKARMQVVILGGLRSVLALLSSYSSSEASLRQYSVQVDASLELLQHATFLSGGMGADPGLVEQEQASGHAGASFGAGSSQGAGGSGDGSAPGDTGESSLGLGADGDADGVAAADDDEGAAEAELHSLSLLPLVGLAAAAFALLVAPPPLIQQPLLLAQSPAGPPPSEKSASPAQERSRAKKAASTKRGSPAMSIPGDCSDGSDTSRALRKPPGDPRAVRRAASPQPGGSTTGACAPFGSTAAAAASAEDSDPFDFETQESDRSSQESRPRSQDSRPPPGRSPLALHAMSAASAPVEPSPEEEELLHHEEMQVVAAAASKAARAKKAAAAPKPPDPFSFDDEAGVIGGLGRAIFSRKRPAPPPRASPVGSARGSPVPNTGWGGAAAAGGGTPPRARRGSPAGAERTGRASSQLAPSQSPAQPASRQQLGQPAGQSTAKTPPSLTGYARAARAKAAAQEVRPWLERERAHRSVLLLTLKVLVNLTNAQLPGCEELLQLPCALPLVASILASEFSGAERRGGLPRHFDTALMCLGLLTNILEVRPDAQQQVGGAPCRGTPFGLTSVAMVSRSAAKPAATPQATLLTLLASVLRSLLQPLPAEPEAVNPSDANGESAAGGNAGGDAGGDAAGPGCSTPVNGGSNTAGVPSGGPGSTPSSRHLEREVAGAYTALLLGFLCRDCPPDCTRVLSLLGYGSFAPVSALLQSFLELHSNAGLLSPEGTKAMASVIQWMRGYGNGNDGGDAPAEGAAAEGGTPTPAGGEAAAS